MDAALIHCYYSSSKFLINGEHSVRSCRYMSYFRRLCALPFMAYPELMENPVRQ